MKTFFDSSSFAKRYIEEPGSDMVEKVCQETSILGTSIIMVPEIISALARKHRKRILSTKEYQLLKNALLQDIRDAQVINLTSKVIACSTTLLEKYSLRAMDSLHIACALAWDAQLFVTSDHQQAQAAEAAGLTLTFI